MKEVKDKRGKQAIQFGKRRERYNLMASMQNTKNEQHQMNSFRLGSANIPFDWSILQSKVTSCLSSHLLYLNARQVG